MARPPPRPRHRRRASWAWRCEVVPPGAGGPRRARRRRGARGRPEATASNMSSIGFVARDEAEFRALAMQAATAGTSVETSAGRYAVWPASGAQLWAQVAPSGSVVGLNPHFDG